MKLIIKILSGILILITMLAVGAFCVFLLPAHIQIRNIETVIPTDSQLDAAFSEVPDDAYPVSISYVNTAEQKSMVGSISHTGMLLRWSDGKTFLIDSGMNEEEAIAFGKPFELLGAEPTIVYGPIEDQIGASIQNIEGIGFTHLHSDHTDGVTRICAALDTPATIFQTQEQKNIQNLHTKAGQEKIAASACEKAVLGKQTIKPVPGFPGLFALSAAGHTPGSTIYLTRSMGKRWFFIGDLTNVAANIDSNEGKGFIYSYLLIPEDEAKLGDWRVWMKHLISMPDTEVIVSHDVNGIAAGDLPEWDG